MTRILRVGFAVLVAALALGTGSASAPAATSPSALGSIRDRVQTWLETSGFRSFRVVEVMAFAANDYAAVADGSGKPAFELLVARGGGWLMEEPASMMWNTRYGMLGHTSGTIEPVPGMAMLGGGGMMGSPSSWYSGGAGPVTSLGRAVVVANRWLAENRPGELAESDGRAYPGYFTLDTTRNGKTFGMLSVHRVSGAVWYHGWHGAFLGERAFR